MEKSRDGKTNIPLRMVDVCVCDKITRCKQENQIISYITHRSHSCESYASDRLKATSSVTQTTPLKISYIESARGHLYSRFHWHHWPGSTQDTTPRKQLSQFPCGNITSSLTFFSPSVPTRHRPSSSRGRLLSSTCTFISFVLTHSPLVSTSCDRLDENKLLSPTLNSSGLLVDYCEHHGLIDRRPEHGISLRFLIFQ